MCGGSFLEDFVSRSLLRTKEQVGAMPWVREPTEEVRVQRGKMGILKQDLLRARFPSTGQSGSWPSVLLTWVVIRLCRTTRLVHRHPRMLGRHFWTVISMHLLLGEGGLTVKPR